VVSSKFACSVCDGETFVSCEYRAPTASCRALECTNCHAITLDEEVARTAKERQSVREMVAVRARIHCDEHVSDEHSVLS
jgi:hypothetical protein